MQSHLISWCAAFGLGALFTAAIHSHTPAISEPDPVQLSLTPAMDLLNNYSCRWAETKHIILGGREDGFSPDGEETTSPGALYDYYVPRTGNARITATRGYDEDGFDNAFVEQFQDVPPRIAHGLFVLRFKQLGTLKTDFMNIGEIVNAAEKSHKVSVLLDPDVMPSNWAFKDGVMSSRLSEMTFTKSRNPDGSTRPQSFKSLLDYMQNESGMVDVVISDDTVVDVIGFALCSEPEMRKGTTFIAWNYLPDIVKAGCSTDNSAETHCNQLAGDTVCSKALPLACFAERDSPLPPGLNRDANLFHEWSGGEISFTEPLRADSLKTQAEGHALCRAQFGEDFRMANVHEGVQSNGFLAEGTVAGVSQVWVDSNLEEYGNCWDIKSDYGEAENG